MKTVVLSHILVRVMFPGYVNELEITKVSRVGHTEVQEGVFQKIRWNRCFERNFSEWSLHVLLSHTYTSLGNFELHLMFASTHVGRRFSYFNLQSSSSKYSEPDLVIFANWVERLDDSFATEILNDVLWCNDGKCCGHKSPETSFREWWVKNEKDSRGDSLKSRSIS